MMTFMARSGILFDPTMAHTPQENAVAEFANRTLFGRVQATFAAARLLFDKYWHWCVLDKVNKWKGTWRRFVQDIPRRLWNQSAKPVTPFRLLSLYLNKFRMFNEYALVLRLQDKQKHEYRALLVRYIHTVDDAHYCVLVPRTRQVFLCCRTNYRPYNPHFDLVRLYDPMHPPSEA